MASTFVSQIAAARPARHTRQARRSVAARAQLVLAPLVPGVPARSPQLERASSAEFELRLAPLVSSGPATTSAPRWAAPRAAAQPLQRQRSSRSSLITRSASCGAADLTLQPLCAGVAAPAPRMERQDSTRQLLLASLVGDEAPATAAPAPAAPLRRRRSVLARAASSRELRLAPLVASAPQQQMGGLMQRAASGPAELVLARLA